KNRYAAQGQGILGDDIFTTRLDDHLTIEADLSQPAYGFLIAFRPDGDVEICDPEDETIRPALTRRLRYPGPSSKAEDIYGLTNGPGLQAFAVVVPRNPFRSYRDWWRQGHGSPPWRAGSPGDPGVVWDDDGEWTLPRMADDRKGLRGKGAKLRGSGPA